MRIAQYAVRLVVFPMRLLLVVVVVTAMRPLPSACASAFVSPTRSRGVMNSPSIAERSTCRKSSSTKAVRVLWMANNDDNNNDDDSRKQVQGLEDELEKIQQQKAAVLEELQKLRAQVDEAQEQQAQVAQDQLVQYENNLDAKRQELNALEANAMEQLDQVEATVTKKLAKLERGQTLSSSFLGGGGAVGLAAAAATAVVGRAILEQRNAAREQERLEQERLDQEQRQLQQEALRQDVGIVGPVLAGAVLGLVLAYSTSVLNTGSGPSTPSSDRSVLENDSTMNQILGPSRSVLSPDAQVYSPSSISTIKEGTSASLAKDESSTFHAKVTPSDNNKEEPREWTFRTELTRQTAGAQSSTATRATSAEEALGVSGAAVRPEKQGTEAVVPLPQEATTSVVDKQERKIVVPGGDHEPGGTVIATSAASESVSKETVDNSDITRSGADVAADSLTPARDDPPVGRETTTTTVEQETVESSVVTTKKSVPDFSQPNKFDGSRRGPPAVEDTAHTAVPVEEKTSMATVEQTALARGVVKRPDEHQSIEMSPTSDENGAVVKQGIPAENPAIVDGPAFQSDLSGNQRSKFDASMLDATKGKGPIALAREQSFEEDVKQKEFPSGKTRTRDRFRPTRQTRDSSARLKATATTRQETIEISSVNDGSPEDEQGIVKTSPLMKETTSKQKGAVPVLASDVTSSGGASLDGGKSLAEPSSTAQESTEGGPLSVARTSDIHTHGSSTLHSPKFKDLRVPAFDTSKLDVPKLDAPKLDLPRFDLPNLDNAPKAHRPKFEAPKFNLPNLDDVPKVDLSKLEAPKFDLPNLDDVPKVDLPKFDALKRNLPKLDESKLGFPTFVAPKLDLSRFDALKLDASSLDFPTFVAPKLDLPNFNTVKIDLPSLNVPKFKLNGKSLDSYDPITLGLGGAAIVASVGAFVLAGTRKDDESTSLANEASTLSTHVEPDPTVPLKAQSSVQELAAARSDQEPIAPFSRVARSEAEVSIADLGVEPSVAEREPIDIAKDARIPEKLEICQDADAPVGGQEESGSRPTDVLVDTAGDTDGAEMEVQSAQETPMDEDEDEHIKFGQEFDSKAERHFAETQRVSDPVPTSAEPDAHAPAEASIDREPLDIGEDTPIVEDDQQSIRHDAEPIEVIDPVPTSAELDAQAPTEELIDREPLDIEEDAAIVEEDQHGMETVSESGYFRSLNGTNEVEHSKSTSIEPKGDHTPTVEEQRVQAGPELVEDKQDWSEGESESNYLRSQPKGKYLPHSKPLEPKRDPTPNVEDHRVEAAPHPMPEAPIVNSKRAEMEAFISAPVVELEAANSVMVDELVEGGREGQQDKVLDEKANNVEKKLEQDDSRKEEEQVDLTPVDEATKPLEPKRDPTPNVEDHRVEAAPQPMPEAPIVNSKRAEMEAFISAPVVELKATNSRIAELFEAEREGQQRKRIAERFEAEREGPQDKVLDEKETNNAEKKLELVDDSLMEEEQTEMALVDVGVDAAPVDDESSQTNLESPQASLLETEKAFESIQLRLEKLIIEAETVETEPAPELNSGTEPAREANNPVTNVGLDPTALKAETATAATDCSADYHEITSKIFPGALSNVDLVAKVVGLLERKGFSPEDTLLSTSLCSDELARRLKDDFVKVYGNNFSLGGLSGFPFAGNTGFGAMTAHIPDDGSSLLVYGPHVGVTRSGRVGIVERDGIELVDNCCGSAIAASNYLLSITEGGARTTTEIQEFTDFQQDAVQEFILPHGKRLADAEDRMQELPKALYESQDLLIQDIVQRGCAGLKTKGLALLGGIQINTAPEALDYFLPLRFDHINNEGAVLDDMLQGLLDD